MTREEVKKKYIIKPKGEIIECFYASSDHIISGRNGKIFIIDVNEFGDVIVLNKTTLKRILNELL